MFLLLRISKNWHFLTPSPPTSDYVIYEWYLSTIVATKMTFHGFHHGEPAEPEKKTEQGKVTL